MEHKGNTNGDLDFYNNIFSNNSGVEYIVYFHGTNGFPSSPIFDKSKWATINDTNIVNFGGRGNSVKLDLGLDLNADTFSGAPGQVTPSMTTITQHASYLMYLDEPVYRRTMEGYPYPVRAQSAMAVACQQFNGTPDEKWNGLKNLAKIRVRSDAFPGGFNGISTEQLQNQAQNRICVNAGSNVNDPVSMAPPIPGPVLKIAKSKLAAGMSLLNTVSIYTNTNTKTSNNSLPGTLLQTCSFDAFNTPCYFDLRGLGMLSDTNGFMQFEIRPSDNFRSKYFETGFGQVPFTSQQSVQVVQTVPTVKWFNKMPDSARTGTAANLVWSYVWLKYGNANLKKCGSQCSSCCCVRRW
ncbi:hypothetical protein ACV22V_31175 [Burkholderia sp. AW33-5]